MRFGNRLTVGCTLGRLIIARVARVLVVVVLARHGIYLVTCAEGGLSLYSKWHHDQCGAEGLTREGMRRRGCTKKLLWRSCGRVNKKLLAPGG